MYVWYNEEWSGRFGTFLVLSTLNAESNVTDRSSSGYDVYYVQDCYYYYYYNYYYFADKNTKVQIKDMYIRQ